MGRGHVPAPSRQRHAAGPRPTHERAAHRAPLDAHREVDRQTLTDGVVGSMNIIPGAVGTGAFARDARAPMVSNRDATVTVDEGGITIDSGSLTLKDEFGSTVLFSSGFLGSWEDYLLTGIKNGSFADNAVANPAANGRTAHCPYWTLAQAVGTPTISTSPGFLAADFSTATHKMTFKSDLIRIAAGVPVSVVITDSNKHSSASVVTREVKIEQYDRTGALAFTTTVLTGTLTGGLSVLSVPRPSAAIVPLGVGAGVAHGSGGLVTHVRILVEVTATTLVASAAGYSCAEVALLVGSASSIGFEALGQATSSCTNNVQTPLVGAFTGSYDSLGWFIGSGGLSVPAGCAGRYRVTFSVNFASGAGTFRRQVLRINAVDTGVFTYGVAASLGHQQTSVWVGDLVDGDVIDFEARQDSGATLAAGIRYLLVERIR